ncbi:MAG: HNH endonuclease [Planctomycetia bacterium]|nr:HNH endonuclease [Planctomycetia bacterium]
MDEATKRFARRRAKNRCEYCHRSQRSSPLARLQFEHIVPKQHGGTDTEDNLALACANCNRQKGPNLTGIDPDTGQIVELFHPRKHRWRDHFRWNGLLIVGRTPTGRATVRVFEMNSAVRLAVREASGRKPKRGRPGSL